MCGIVGYIGGRDATPIVLKGLKKLEYRGYDSVGVAVLDDLKRIHDEVLAGIRDVGEGDAKLALDVLKVLVGFGESSEEYVEVSSADILVSLCFIGLLASFFVGGFPLWFDAVRIPLLVLAGLYLFGRLVRF